MVKQFSQLYLKQFARLLVEIGLFRGIFLLFFFLLLFIKISSNAYSLSAITFLFIFSIHLMRNDKNFLKITLQNDKLLYLIHYQIILLPVYIMLLFLGDFWAFFFLFGGVSALPYIGANISAKNNLFDILRNIPIRNFEFKSGIRKNLGLLLLLYLSSLVFYQYSYVSLGYILIFTFISTSFYNEGEPRQMLEVYGLSPFKFLSFKIKNQLLDFWMSCIPLILLFLFQKTEYWYILLVFMIISSIIQALSICLKYAFYEPGKKMDNSIFISVYALSIFVPFFVPVPLVMLVKYFRRALSNLNNYLYDYH